MAYRLVKGTFNLLYEDKHYVGSQPDGETVGFEPDDPKRVENLGKKEVRYERDR